MLKKLLCFSFVLACIGACDLKNSLSFETCQPRPLFGQYNYAADKLLAALVNFHNYSLESFFDIMFDGLLDLHRCILETGYAQNHRAPIDRDDLEVIAYYLDKIVRKFSDLEIVANFPRAYAVVELINEAVVRVEWLIENGTFNCNF